MAQLVVVCDIETDASGDFSQTFRTCRGLLHTVVDGDHSLGLMP